MQYAEPNQTNVIAATFESDDAAYGALAELKQLDADGVIDIHGAAVVTRDEDGRVVTKDATGAKEPLGIATGGIVGLLIGILGGPLGILIGGTTGVLVGSLFDLDEAEDTESVLAALSKTVRNGQDTLLAELREAGDHSAVDGVMASRPGTVLRRDVHDVEAEIAAAELAQREASREARKRLWEERRQRQRSEVEAKVAEMKAKLPSRHRGEPSRHEDKAGAEVGATA